MIGEKPLNLSTLTDIAQFLSEQNIKMDKLLTQQEKVIATFSSDLDSLQREIVTKG